MSKLLYGMRPRDLTLRDEEIGELFGQEAAEDDSPERLRQYYFKSDVYDEIAANMPLRIVVGHKGIGKSAVFQVLKQELEERNGLTLSIAPDDIAGITEDASDMLQLIRHWKEGLKGIIVEKVIERLCSQAPAIGRVAGNIVNVAVKILEQKAGVDLIAEKKELTTAFMASRKLTVFVDDLDRGWEGKKSDIRRVSAMLNAVRDLARENPGVYFKVSLRTDVYYLFRTSDESTDKVEGNVVWLAWNNFQILALLAKRIITFFGGTASEDELMGKTQQALAVVLNRIFFERFEGSGKWDRIPTYRLLTSLIRKRPRDLVKLCSAAAREARRNRTRRIGTREFSAVFEEYSQGRLQDTIIEFRSELPDIEKLLTNMKPTKQEKHERIGYLYTTDRLYLKVKNIMQNYQFRFTNGRPATHTDLCAFMYKINFLTARKDKPNEIVRKYFEENRFLINHFADFGFDWEVHPAYRWALQPDDPIAVMNSLAVYEDG